MTLRRPAALLAIAIQLVGCAATPPPVAVRPPPMMTRSGLVIGTLSYQYVDVARHAWVVHFERIDTPAAQDYAMVVAVDPATRSGVFTGTLPAGVYAFRDAASEEQHFEAGALLMPFEVQPGEVRDAGHYALNPITAP